MKLRTTLPGILLTLLIASTLCPAQAPAAQPTGQSKSRAPKAGNPGINTRLFQVVMVKADSAGESTTGELPKSARAALADLGDFLPYKNYTLLDTALMRTAGHAQTRVKNDHGGEYVISMSFRMVEDADQEIFVQNFRVVFHPASVPMVTERGAARKGAAASIKIAPSVVEAKTFIDTSFGMKIGETLVVGSSRLNGGKTALIFLVTAVP
jgi:hypothetical protein